MKDFRVTSRMQSCVILALLVALGIGLRCLGLARPLGGGDENEFLLFWGYSSIEYILTQYNDGGHQVFHTILVRLMILGFGENNEIAIRFPAFFFGVAGLWMVYLLAQRLFRSQWTSRLALLFSAVSLIHIHYSQTARGYSLVIFFSAAMIYATIRLLESGQHWKWGTLLTLCGFLSVYTIPTNVYFAVALAGWVLLVLLAPHLSRDFGIKPVDRNRFLTVFTVVFLTMALLSFLAHWPFIRAMQEAAKEYYTPRVESSILKLSYAVVQEIFQDPLQWFLPFLVVGVVWGKTIRPVYRLLPVFIFLVPFGINLAVGLTGFARNYLFNWPLFMIFLAAGLVRTGWFLENKISIGNRGIVAGSSLVVLYVLVSLKTIIFDRFPTLLSTGGHAYKRMVEKYSDPLDLVIIANSKNFLYARSVYLKNLKNIFLLNKLSGVKIIAADPLVIINHEINDGHEGFPVFRHAISPLELEGKEVQPGLKIFSLAGPDVRSLLPEDFEVETQWKTIRGGGIIGPENVHKLVGKGSLFLEANHKDILVVEASVPGIIELKRDTLAVLLFSGYNLTLDRYGPGNTLAVPTIWAWDLKNKQMRRLRTGYINLGIRSEMQGALIQTKAYNEAPYSYVWALHSYVGYLPPGRYTLNLRLVAPKGQSTLYDGLRLFLVETHKAEM